MAQATFFDDIDDKSSAAKPRKPIWSIDHEGLDNKSLLDWLNATASYIEDENHERDQENQRHLALYKGIQYRDQETRRDLRDTSEDRSKAVRKIVINHLFDLVKNRVAKLIKFKPNVAVLPTNDEFDDKNSAKITKTLLDHIWYIHNFEGEISPQVARDTNVLGESYLFVTWNPNLGDLHPDFVRAKQKFERVPLMGEDGNQAKDERGNPIWIENEVKVGDVDYEIELTMNVLVESGCDSYKKSSYIFRRKVDPVEKVRLMYPDRAHVIKPSEDRRMFDFEKMQLEPAGDRTIYYEFYHKRTPQITNGKYIVFTKEAILENSDYPYSHDNFPCVRYTDIEYPGELHGVSFFRNTKMLTGAYNNLTNMILRNQIIASQPKWMLPAGSAKIDALGNDITIVQYKGPVPPQLVQGNPTPREVFEFREMLKQEFESISGVGGVTKGEPPPGIKAGIALQFLAEQENERFNEPILKWNEFIREVAEMTIAVAGDYYDATDERMVRVVGKDNEWRLQSFDSANLSKDYDIIIQNASALPKSVAARTQTILDLNERFPDMFTGEQVLEMLDLAQSDKFTNLGTVSVNSAEAENEKIMEGDSSETLEPQEFEDHITHWTAHMKKIRSYSFKNQTPIKVQERLIEHVMVHEMFLIDQAKRNPAMLDKISALNGFPVFFRSPDVKKEEQEKQQATGQSQAQAASSLPADVQTGGEAQQEVNPSDQTIASRAQELAQLPNTVTVQRTVPPSV